MKQIKKPSGKSGDLPRIGMAEPFGTEFTLISGVLAKSEVLPRTGMAEPLGEI